MSFRQKYPNYEQFDERDYHYRSAPKEMLGPIKAYVLRFCKTADGLKAVCNHIASLIPTERTQNWGWDWLVNDFERLFDLVAEGKLHKLMDFLAFVAERYVRANAELEDLNSVFEQFDFGYRLQLSEHSFTAEWHTVAEAHLVTQSIHEAILTTADVCEQATQHLRQAKEHLRNDDDERPRKDAVRDCLSAMESVVKFVTGAPTFDAGCRVLRGDSAFGPRELTADPQRIWDRVHDMYPDVRHGQSSPSTMSYEEAAYWIDRITAITLFLVRVHRGKHP